MNKKLLMIFAAGLLAGPMVAVAGAAGPSFDCVVNGESVDPYDVVVVDDVYIVNGTKAGDYIDCSYSTVDLLINGGKGNDELAGGYGNDELRGGHGDDILNGGPGSDLIQGGQGDDTMDCGGDHYGGYDSDEDTVKGGNGFDSVTNCDGDDLVSLGRHQ